MKTYAFILVAIVSGTSITACAADSKDEHASDGERKNADRGADGASSEAPSSAPVDPARQAELERQTLQRHLQAAARSPQRRVVSDPDPEGAREAALAAARRDAFEFGMIGLLNSGAGGDPDAPTSPWGREDSLGSGGVGALSGSGGGRLGGTHKKAPPKVRMGATTVTGRLPPEVIQRIVRQNFGRFRLCYENGLRTEPTLSGKITIKFDIKTDGSVGGVKAESDMPDRGVVECVRKGFYGLSFPQPEGGPVSVSYPILFTPGDAPAEAGKAPAPASDRISLNGKPLATVSWEDVKAALEKAGCTDVTKVEDPAIAAPKVVLSAKKDGKNVTITLVTGATLAEDEVKALEASGAVYVGKLFLLAIAVEGDTARTSSKALLDAIVVR